MIIGQNYNILYFICVLFFINNYLYETVCCFDEIKTTIPGLQKEIKTTVPYKMNNHGTSKDKSEYSTNDPCEQITLSNQQPFLTENEDIGRYITHKDRVKRAEYVTPSIPLYKFSTITFYRGINFNKFATPKETGILKDNTIEDNGGVYFHLTPTVHPNSNFPCDSSGNHHKIGHNDNTSILETYENLLWIIGIAMLAIIIIMSIIIIIKKRPCKKSDKKPMDDPMKSEHTTVIKMSSENQYGTILEKINATNEEKSKENMSNSPDCKQGTNTKNNEKV